MKWNLKIKKIIYSVIIYPTFLQTDFCLIFYYPFIIIFILITTNIVIRNSKMKQNHIKEIK